MYRVHWTHNHHRFMSPEMSYTEAVEMSERVKLDPSCDNVEIRLA